jgi:septal ring factor EnvC (AmiA/AmiB activator)
MRLPRLSQAVSPAAATALFATTGVVWLLTTKPGSSVGIIGSGAPITPEQWAVLLSTVLGTAVLLGGLFAIGAYLAHRPAVKLRQIRQSLDRSEAELTEVQLLASGIARKVAALRQALAHVDALQDELSRPLDDVSPEMRRVRRMLDDILHELETAGVSAAEPARM